MAGRRRTVISSLLETHRLSTGSTDSVVIERTFLVTARRFRSTLLHLLDGLATGSIDLQEFTRSSNRALRDAFGVTYNLGALSVDSFHTLTPRDIRIIDREISEQQHFLRILAKDLQRGFFDLHPRNRSGLYLQSLRGMFELGRAESAIGPFLWKLGETEHCLECYQAAAKGPYQKDNFSGLGLPTLPGIPGIGDICLGLTRCGCTIKALHPLPNEHLQDRLRELLVEELYDTS